MQGGWDADLAMKGWVDVEDVQAQIAKAKAEILMQYAPGLLVAERLAAQVAELRGEVAAMKSTISGLHAEVADLKAEVAKLRLGVPVELGAPAPTPERRAKYSREQKLLVLRRLDKAKTTPAKKRRCVACGKPRGFHAQWTCGDRDCAKLMNAAQFDRRSHGWDEATVRMALANIFRQRDGQPQRLKPTDEDEMVIVAGIGVRQPSGAKAR
jgi:hypothetical protein